MNGTRLESVLSASQVYWTKTQTKTVGWFFKTPPYHLWALLGLLGQKCRRLPAASAITPSVTADGPTDSADCRLHLSTAVFNPSTYKKKIISHPPSAVWGGSPAGTSRSYTELWTISTFSPHSHCLFDNMFISKTLLLICVYSAFF